jgi:hypothetical protein
MFSSKGRDRALQLSDLKLKLLLLRLQPLTIAYSVSKHLPHTHRIPLPHLQILWTRLSDGFSRFLLPQRSSIQPT